MNIRLLCLLVAAGFGTSAGASDLLDVYGMAIANDTTYQSAVYERQALSLDPVIAQSALRPQVNLSGSVDRIRDDVDSSVSASTGSDNYNSLGVALSLDQALYDPQAKIAVEQARLGDDRAAYDLQTAQDDVIIRVATSYFAVLGALDNLDLATSEKVAIGRQLELAQERLNVGIGTQTDLYDAQARYQLAEANEIDARNLIEDAIQALVAIVGGDPGNLDPLREDAVLQQPAPESADEWVNIAISNNPALRSATLDYEIAQREIDFLKYTRHPQVGLNASGSYLDNSGGISGSSDSTEVSVGLQVTFPLYLGGAVEAQVQKAALFANAQEQAVEFARREVAREIRDVFNDVASGINRVEAFRQAVIAGESAVESKQEGFAAGLITNLDVLDAQRDLYQARRDYLRARYDFILSTLDLERAAGQLDEDDIARVNGLLE